MVPTVPVKNANTFFNNIRLAVLVDKTAAGVGTVGSKSGIYFRIKVSEFFQYCHNQMYKLFSSGSPGQMDFVRSAGWPIFNF